jgi:hypothetical protein
VDAAALGEEGEQHRGEVVLDRHDLGAVGQRRGHEAREHRELAALRHRIHRDADEAGERPARTVHHIVVVLRLGLPRGPDRQRTVQGVQAGPGWEPGAGGVEEPRVGAELGPSVVDAQHVNQPAAT